MELNKLLTDSEDWKDLEENFNNMLYVKSKIENIVQSNYLQAMNLLPKCETKMQCLKVLSALSLSQSSILRITIEYLNELDNIKSELKNEDN